MKREAMNGAWEQFEFGEFGYWGLKEKKKVKVALSQSVGPTKSKIFWVIKVGNSAKHATLGSCGISVISDEL